jgi:hypothetical protein
MVPIVELEGCRSLCGNLVRTVAILLAVERSLRSFLREMRGNQGKSRELGYMGDGIKIAVLLVANRGE